MDILFIIVLAGFVSIFILILFCIFVIRHAMNKLVTLFGGGDDDLQKTFVIIKSDDSGILLEDNKYRDFSTIKRKTSGNFYIDNTCRMPFRGNSIASLSTADIDKVINPDGDISVPVNYPLINIHPVDAFVVMSIGSVYRLDDPSANNNNYDEYMIELLFFYIAPTNGSVTSSRLAVSLVSAQGLSKDGRKNSTMKFALDEKVVFLDENEKSKALFMNIRQDKSPTRTIEGGWTANIFIEEVEKVL